MAKIRINELARELEVKSHVVIEYLAEIGQEVKSHSSALEDDVAAQVRNHFLGTETSGPAKPAPAPPVAPTATPPEPAAKPVPPAEPVVARPVAPPTPSIPHAKTETPIHRTLDQIKEDARRALAAQRAAEKPPAPAAGPVSAPVGPAGVAGVRRPVSPGTPTVPAGVLTQRPPSSPPPSASAAPAAPAAARPREGAPATTSRGTPLVPGLAARPAAGGGPSTATAGRLAGANPATKQQPIYPGI